MPMVAGAVPSWLLAGCAQLSPRAATTVLRPAPAQQDLGLPVDRPTAVWGYNGSSPGPLLRFRQGDTVEIDVDNALPESTTVHWHGLRVPIAMDGVPHVSHPPIQPGARFRYRLPLTDAGTYWYHPHQRGFEQVTRGLYGALIVEERNPPVVDEDWAWVIADWRLDPTGALRAEFENRFDMSHAGRIGNTVTINGKLAMFRDADPRPLEVKAGTRIRLRLLNASVARSYQLVFDGAAPLIVAFDGHPVEPHSVPDVGVIVGAGQRVDLILDMPSGNVTLCDRFDDRREYVMRTLVGMGAAVPRPAFKGLPPNPLPAPDLERAMRHTITLDGGARSRMPSAKVHGKDMPIARLVREHGMAWAMNGTASNEHVHEPLLTVPLGASVILRIENRTAWSHPMHLHGHAFRVLAVDGKPTRYREWRDTAIVDPNGVVEIGFVADNPGDWMFHCHILQHQQGGLMASLRVR
jgi:FtsP/CotA-like multicopper oxidase with cupredoxin domain